MRISDWSSDVCSSVLPEADVQMVLRIAAHQPAVLRSRLRQQHPRTAVGAPLPRSAQTIHQRSVMRTLSCGKMPPIFAGFIIRDRKSVVSGKGVSGRVDLGGRGVIKKKKTQNKD